MSKFITSSITGFALLSLAIICSAPAAAASESGKTKHAVHAIAAPHESASVSDLVLDTVEERRSNYGLVYEGSAEAKYAGSEHPAFADFYPFPEPKQTPAVVSESVGSNAVYWIGASGAALIAGIAAYFIFSEEPKSPAASIVVP